MPPPPGQSTHERGDGPARPRGVLRACGIAGLVLAASAAALARPNPDVAAPAAWEYRVSVDPGLRRMTVRACFRGPPPNFLQLDDESALEFVRVAASDEPGPALRPSAGGLVVEGLGPEGCVEYAVDLEALASAKEEAGVSRVGRDLLVPPGLWLLRPPARPPEVPLRVSFDLPEGIDVSVPWEPVPDAPRPTWSLDASAFTIQSVSAFGRFRRERIEVSGTVIEAAVLDAPVRATREGVRRWLGEAARAVATIYGRFPAPRLQVVVRPVSHGSEPVAFGRTFYGGGRGLVLLLSSRAGDADLLGEWVGVHEMVHTTMPAIRPEDAWFAEGVATYYQEIARARSGLRTEAQAWQYLHEGFERGRGAGTGRPLAEDSRELEQRHAYRRVYWAGAAIAFLADLELRRTTGGAVSLDDFLRALAELDHRPRLYTAAELIESFEARTGRGVFGRLASAHLPSTEFPDLTDAYAALGLKVEDGRVRLGEDPAAERLRRAIAGLRRDG